MAAFTQADLDKLDKAIRLGARRVKYEDREYEFRSLREMQSLRREMKAALGTGRKGIGKRVMEHDKGLGT